MPRGKDLDDFDPLPAERYVNEPPWRWASKKRTLEEQYPEVVAPAPDLSDNIRQSGDRDDESRLADYIDPGTLEIYQARARRKETAKTLLKRGKETGKVALEKGKETGKVALEMGGTALVVGGRAMVQGAQMASEGIRRYGEWVDQTNAKAIARQEREREQALERRQREVERRKTAMDLQREQRQLDLEERRINLEMMREEAKFRKEFGDQFPRGGSPSQQQGSPFGFAPPQRQMEYGFGAPRQQGPSFDFGTPQRPRQMEYRFGTPAPQFRTPADIVNYDGGINLFGPGPQRPAPKKQGRKTAPSKKRSSR